MIMKTQQMKNQKKPMRKCIACNTSYPQEELIRFTLQDGEIVRDQDNRNNGRGLYLCNRKECFDLAVKKKAFNRACRLSSITFKEEYNVEEN